MAVRTRAVAGQLCGVLAGATVLTLVIVLGWWNPYVPGQGAVTPRMVPTVLGAVGALLGAWHRSSSLLVASFLVGFFPWLIGPYLFGTPGVFRWIPVAEAGYLLSALLLRRDREAAA